MKAIIFNTLFIFYEYKKNQSADFDKNKTLVCTLAKTYNLSISTFSSIEVNVRIV